MSNILVGNIYSRIMDEVIDSCHTSFEEEGVARSTLDELKKVWQKKLSERRVAAMPWDPASNTQQTNANSSAASAPSNSTSRAPSQSVPASAPAPAPAPTSSNANGGVYIKNEPNSGSGYDMQSLPPSNAVPLSGNQYNSAALQRAGQHLQEKFGPAASAQVNALQARVAMAGQNGLTPARSQPQSQLPPLTDEQRRANDEARRAYIEQQRRQHGQYQNLPHPPQRPTINNAQTDGADDWNNMVAERRAAALESESAVYEADMTIRQRVEQMAREMEGGGLMLPLSEHARRPIPTKRKTTQPGNASRSPKIPQLDGEDESDDDDKKGSIKDDPDVNDEDAINSDLDDPDDDVVEETEEDGNTGEVMLCTYDKVQRVKNKWKCMLKDGVLTTGGKEYVFNKAHGEFEW